MVDHVIISFAFFNPLDLKSLSWKVASSALFVSNLAFTFLGGGYFAESAQSNWLLHTWSLSTEWQFYLAYPLLIVFIRKVFGASAVFFFLLTFFIVSFLASVSLSSAHASSSYFNLHTRAWQMLAGGLILYLPPIQNGIFKKSVFSLGSLLLFGAIFILDGSMNWPGWLASIPVIGAVFVIYSGVQNAKLINNKVVQYIGTWSYSIYLWHWPLVVAIYVYGLHELTKLVGVFLSIILGWLSYRYVESIKFNTEFKGMKLVVNNKPLWGVATVSALATLMYLNDGAEWRLSSDQLVAFKEVKQAKNDWSYPEPNITVGDSNLRKIEGSGTASVLFLGASHIEQTYPYVSNLYPRHNVYYLTKSGCLPIETYNAPRWSCKNVHTYKSLVKEVKFEKVVLSAYLFAVGIKEGDSRAISRRIKDIELMVQFLARNVREIVLILPEPYHESFDPLVHYRRGLADTISIIDAKKKHKLVYDIKSQITFPENLREIDPFQFFCFDTCNIREGNKYVYRDAGHTRPWFAKKSMSYLDAIVGIEEK